MRSLLKVVIILPTALLYTKELPIIERPRYNVMNIDKLKKERLISTHNQGSEFYFRLKDKTKKVFIKEEPRVSKISKDLMDLVELGTAIINLPQPFTLIPKNSNFKPKKECIYYKQSFKRASVYLATIDENNNSTIYNFKVGSIEHLYLTTDMPITDIKKLSFNQENSSFYKTKQPSALYLGANYKLGDIYLDYPIDKFYNNFSLKGMVEISSRPTKSMGIGIGYHLTKGVELFIAKLWTDNIYNKNRTPTIAYGVSFNLNRALEQVKEIYNYK